MQLEVQEFGFSEGFAVGVFTGRLKHEAPIQIKEWVALAQINDFKGTLRKYNYTISGVTAHPTDSTQVLLTAEKTAEGTNSKLVQAFTHSDRFMDGWEAGCLDSLLRYGNPEQLEQWVKINNVDAIQQVLDEHHYTIKSMRIHPQDKRWTMVTAAKA
jgi:hypothetical protein